MVTVGLVTVAASLLACHGFVLDSFTGKDHPWDGLKVTWGLNPFNSYNFADLPRTEKDALSQKFVKISDCSSNTKFLGKRYVKDNDYTAILIYDSQGYIAGIQAGITFITNTERQAIDGCHTGTIPNNLKNGYPSAYLKNHPLVLDGDKYFITAYFVKPSLICGAGRTATEYSSQGTGTDLYLQNSTDPMAAIMIPHQEADIGRTRWVKGKCFAAMGVHYWYNIRQDMSCDEFFPMFLLYNGGVLNAFGWAFQGDLASPRIEHPPQNVISQFMDPVPTCLYNAGTLSTLHIYVNGHPQTDLFCA